MKASRSGVVLALAGIGTTGALTLGVVAPASAVDVYDYRAYAQTLPYSVIQGLDLDSDEETKVTSNTRTSVVGDKTAIPLKSTTGPNWRLLGPVVGSMLWIDGQIESTIEFDRDGERPEWIDQGEWDACAQSGGDDWTGNFFDGFRDWTATFQGTDCNDVRDGWQVEKDPDYEPIGQSGGLPGWPITRYNSTFSTGVTFNRPFWSNTPTASTTDAASRVEGWVLPIDWTQGTTYVQVGISIVNQASQVVSTSTVSVSQNIANSARPVLTNWPQCQTVEVCFVVGSQSQGAMAGTAYMASTRTVNIGGTNTATTEQQPYVNPTDGSSYSPGLARQVILAWARTASGNVYQCRTVSFVETDPLIPRPCTPQVPPGETITETGWEVVPETDTGYIPGSDPTRGIQTTTVPDVVRDWGAQPDREPGSIMDLRKIGLGSCFDYPEACLEWFEQEDKQSKYECWDGSRAVALSECTKYARLFKPGAIGSATAYPAPGPNPGATPPGSTSPSPAPGTAPGTGPSDPTRTRECFPTGWGMFNPFEWVFKPVKCVLEWAFVPRESVIKANNIRLDNSWRTKTAIRQIVAGFETMLAAIPQDGGCGGIPLNVTLPGGVVISEQLLNACGGALAPAAATTKSILTGSIILAGFLACVRYVAVIFGFVGYGQTLDMRAAEKAERRGES